MEGSDIAVPRIISEILKLAFAVHWLDERGERLFGKCRRHTAWGDRVLYYVFAEKSIENENNSLQKLYCCKQRERIFLELLIIGNNPYRWPIVLFGISGIKCYFSDNKTSLRWAFFVG